jgi:hypothetical protein
MQLMTKHNCRTSAIGLRALASLVLASWLGCTAAQAKKRVALVIGNSAYKSAPKLGK